MTRYAIPADEFLAWAADFGVGPHPRRPDDLTLLPPAGGGTACVWALPADPAAWPPFLTALLTALDPWAAAYLWPQSGRWPAAAGCKSPREGLCQHALRATGIPDGGAGAVRFDRDEADVAVAVLCAVLAYGRHPADDVWVVPDHCQQVARTDHTGAVHVECRNEDRVLELVEHMGRAGYPPTEPPVAPVV